MLTQNDNLFNTGKWVYMQIEILIALIAPQSYFDGVLYQETNTAWKVTVNYEINDIILGISFVKLYFPLRFSLYLTDFLNPRSQRVCFLYGGEANEAFAIKCLVKNNPVKLLIILLGCSILIFGYLFRIFEAKYSEASG